MIVLQDVSFPKNDVKLIYHLSDIHIRTTDERYEEYNAVFQKFCKDIHKPEDSLIVITGDILHSKTQLTATSIRELIELMIMLSNITDVVIILGNHDLPANNIIGDNIINIITHKNFETKHRLFVFTFNELYQYKNIIFGNTLVYSTYVTPCKENINTHLTKIALFHGPIYGSKRNKDDTGMESSIKISDFEDYDIGLFGDIHYHQYMDAKNHFGYSGSFVQQNFGEDLDGHGYIKWDIEQKKSKFTHIPNDYGYVTFKIKSIDEIVYPRLNHLHARLICTDMTQQDINTVETELRSKYDLIEFVVSRENSLLAQVKQPDELNELNEHNEPAQQSQTIVNVQNDSDIVKLFNDAILEVYPDYNDLDKTLEYIKIELQVLGHDSNNEYNKKEYKRISLNQIKFKNLFAYGSGNKINFKNMNGIVGLVAPNFTGKSSLIDSILFSMYEKSSRGQRIQCVNVSKKTFSSNINLTVNGQIYDVLREGARTQKGSTATINITKDEKIVECDDKLHYNNHIVDNICSFDTFIDMAFILQTSSGYVDHSEEERKEILFQIMNLNIFHKLYKRIKASLAQSRLSVSKLRKDLDESTKDCDANLSVIEITTKYDDIKSALEKLYITRDNLEQECDKFKTTLPTNDYTDEDYQTAQQEHEKNIEELVIHEHNKKTHSLELSDINIALKYYDADDVDRTMNDFTSQQNKVIEQSRRLLHNLDISIELDKEQYEYITEMNEVRSKLDTIKLELAKYPENVYDVVARIESLTHNLNELEQKKSECDERTSELEIKYEKLKNHKFNPNCEFCIKNSMTVEKQYLEQKLKDESDILNNIIDNMSSMEMELSECLKNTQSVLEYRKLFKRFDKLTKKLWELQQICCSYDVKDTIKMFKNMKCIEYENYTNYTAKQVELERELIVVENKILKIKTKERENIQIIDTYEKYAKNKCEYEKYDGVRTKLVDIIREIKKTERELIEMETQRVKIVHMNGVKEKYSQELNMGEQALQRYLLLYNIYTKHGVVDKILCNRIIPELEAGVNDLLRTVTDFQIKITYNGSGLCIERIITSPEGETTLVNAKLLSGFEHDVLNLIFKIKFNQLNAFIKTDFLILDEVLSSADDTHLNKLEHLFSYIKEHYKWCLLITHLGAMKNYFTQTISIDKSKGLSRIVVK